MLQVLCLWSEVNNPYRYNRGISYSQKSTILTGITEEYLIVRGQQSLQV
jgi:hypothetical protein